MKELFAIFKFFKNYPFLTGGLLLAAIHVSKTAAETLSQIIGVDAIVSLCLILQLWLMVRPIRSKTPETEVFEIQRLTDIVIQKVRNLKGSIVIFNIELNTLDKTKLWESFLKPTTITEVRLLLPAHIFLRLEHLLKRNEHPETLKLLRDAGGKLKIYPVTIEKEWQEAAFALFEPTDAVHWSVLFPKVRPFSQLNVKHQVWNYTHFLVSSCPFILKTCRDVIQKIQSLEANTTEFSLKEIDGFNEGKPGLISDILDQHGATPEQRVRFPELVVRDKEEQSPPQLDGDMLRIRSNIYNSNRQRAVDIYFVNNQSEEPVKPLLLWLPPWGVPNWRGITKPMDDVLAKYYRIGHMNYSQNAEEYTFTGAGFDMQRALDQVTQLHAQLKIYPKDFAIVGVSVSAFMAAEMAKWRGKDIKSLCLLMPAVDLFGALDTFRKKELFTRKFYMTKDKFKASQLGRSLKYFDAHMELYHLFDLQFRGAKTCNLDWFIENLGDYIKSGGKVCIACSKQDTMTVKSVVETLEEALGQTDCVFKDIEWLHDVRRGMRSYSTVRASSGALAPTARKLDKLVAWLSEQASARYPE